MIEISYETMATLISVVWCAARAAVWLKNKRVDWRRELRLLLVYICILVVVRFTFFPFGKVDGRIRPLIFDAKRARPFRINLIPFVYMTDYDTRQEAVLHFVGNTLMFLPLGIAFPAVYKGLDTHKKALAAGVGASLLIEILQLPFCDRVSDIDDLILNSLGYALGYLIFWGVKRLRRQ